MWAAWMEHAVGHIGLSPTEFWNLSPREWSAIKKGYADKRKVDLRDHLTCSWYSGAMSQADIKKSGLTKFLKGVDEWLFPEETNKKKETDFERLKKLWDSKTR